MTDCEICYESFGQNARALLVCTHTVCLDCFFKLGDHCPFCRAPLVVASFEGGSRLQIQYLHQPEKAPLVLCVNLGRTLFSDIKKLIILSGYIPFAARQMSFLRKVPLKFLADDKTCSFYNINEDDLIFIKPRLSGD